MSVTHRSLSEIRALVTKAVRGAGCSWGMAEEAGLAVRALESHGLPGTAALAKVLETPRRCACKAGTTGPLCGIAEMAAVTDMPPQDALALQDVVGALLLVAPFCHVGVGAWRLDTGAGRVEISAQGVRQSGTVPTSATALRLARVTDAEGDVPAPDLRSRPLNDALWARLEAFAARTYVPESATSRATGAGPGNDAD